MNINLTKPIERALRQSKESYLPVLKKYITWLEGQDGVEIFWDIEDGEDWGAVSWNEGFLILFRSNFPLALSHPENPFLPGSDFGFEFETVFVENPENDTFTVRMEEIDDPRFVWRTDSFSSIECTYDELWFATL